MVSPSLARIEVSSSGDKNFFMYGTKSHFRLMGNRKMIANSHKVDEYPPSNRYLWRHIKVVQDTKHMHPQRFLNWYNPNLFFKISLKFFFLRFFHWAHWSTVVRLNFKLWKSYLTQTFFQKNFIQWQKMDRNWVAFLDPNWWTQILSPKMKRPSIDSGPEVNKK